jgi:uncharacterized protein involved in cysteine biosynthesis
MSNMAPTGEYLKSVMNKTNGLSLFSHGCQAFKHIPGLKGRYIKGVILTILLATVIFSLLFFFVYDAFIVDYIHTYADKLEKWWSFLSYLTTPIVWIVKIFLWVLMMAASFKIAVICMGFWIDLIVEAVISHYRGGPDTPFSLGHFFKSTSKGIYLSVKNIAFAFIFVILGFIPIVGVFFGFFGLACSNGFDIVSPYILVLAENDKKILTDFKMDKFQTFKVGWIQAILVTIPILGWFVMPFTMLLQIIGYAHYIEKNWQESQL